MEKFIIGSDHGGYSRKEEVKEILQKLNIDFEDIGTFDGTSPVDYPDIAKKVAESLISGIYHKGILLCGTGIGISIAANKFPGIRAALCYGKDSAMLSRSHNNANILVLPGRLNLADNLYDILKLWIETEFEGGRHAVRLEKIENIQKNI